MKVTRVIQDTDPARPTTVIQHGQGGATLTYDIPQYPPNPRLWWCFDAHGYIVARVFAGDRAEALELANA